MEWRFKYVLFTVILINACNTTKFLAPGQKLYIGSEIKLVNPLVNKVLKNSSGFKAELTSLIRPRPNSKILGQRIKLWIYYAYKNNRKKGLKHLLFTKFAEPPVLMNDVDILRNSKILENRLQNEGYFLAQVNGDTVTQGKIGKVIFSVKPSFNYTIHKVIFPNDKDDLDTAILGTSNQTRLILGENYNLDIIKAERLRIDAQLKEEGFYYFSPDDLIMKVDSNIKDHQVDVYIKVKDNLPIKASKIYSINRLYVYPHYTLRDTALKLDSAVKYRWYYVVDPGYTVHPFVFRNSVLLHPGEVYNRDDHNKSLNRFINLGPFKYVKNRFQNISSDSSKFDVFYFLTPYPKKSLQLDLIGRTNSANYTGTQLNLNWKNRNTFKGLESLTFTLFGSRDIQFSGQNNGYNVYEAGFQTVLTWPRFISPWQFRSDNDYIPHSSLTLGYTLINRSKLYTLNSFLGSFGYEWKENANSTQGLNLINITLVDALNVTQQYRDSILATRNPTLAHVIDNQFTFGPSYSYSYTNTTELHKVNTFYYSGKVLLSGNIYGLVTGADTLKGKVSKLFGLIFNQFVKVDNELHFYHKFNPNHILASRIIVGIGLPYGNSTQLPYSQQYFIGGTNSLRGFRARSIGPGNFTPNESITSGSQFLPDESGDIKLETNLEYRPKLFSIVSGALFLDIGNVWLLKSHAGLPGGNFTNQFLSQLAADIGFGLRFDLNLFVLRTDLGFPIRNPFPAGQPLKFDSKNSVFNLAIGYPF